MGADSISSDALLLLLETVNKQASQIKRLEAIVSGDTYGTYDTSSHRHGSDRPNKQLQQLQSSLQSLEQQHAASDTASKAMADQLHKMEQRIQHLEVQGRTLQQQGQQLQQQLGSPAQTRTALPRSANAAYLSSIVPTSSGTAATAEDTAGCLTVGLTHAGAPAAGKSMAARLAKLEQQVDALTGAAAVAEEKLQSATSAVQVLDDEATKQLHNIRADVKQAITVASSSLRADMEAAAQARQQEDAMQLKEQLKSLASELDGLVASSQHNLAVNLTAEVERRTTATREASEAHIAALRAQLDRLEEEKADVTLVTQYTGQVADVFEQLATTVADSTQASIAQLMTQQQELRSLVTTLSASKADGSNLLQHQQHCQQQLLELQRGLAAAQSAASEAAVAAAVAKAALEPVDSLRLQLAETQGTVSALQATAAGLEAATNSNCTEQQQQAQQLQQLASSQHMLQQQLLALTNHVDPAAAAQLAAAAAGDESALTFQPLGPLASGPGSILSNPMFDGAGGPGAWEEAWASGCYLQIGSHPGGQAHTTQAGGVSTQTEDMPPSTATAGATDAGGVAASKHGPDLLRPVAGDAAGPSAAGGTCQSIGSSSNGEGTPGTRAAAAGRGFADRMSAVLRHLPVAVRLMRLEAAVRDLSNALAQKAPAGDVQGLQQQLESISHRLVSGLTQLEAVSSSSMRRLEEQAATLADAVAVLSDNMHATTSEVHQAASAAAEGLRQQLNVLTSEVDAVKARLRGAGQDLQHLWDWQAQADKQLEGLQLGEQQVKRLGEQMQQMQQQVTADLSRQQLEVQQQLARHSAEITRDTIKQIKADQEAMQGSAEAHARVSSLESKLKVVVAEVDRMQDQAALTARLQDKHTDMMAAFEAALSAQSSKYAAVSQQLRLELREALAKAQQPQSVKADALESSLGKQSDALADLAATVAALPSTEGLLEAARKGAKTTVGEVLSQYRKQEEGRWEVWLSEFARAMEQRPTAAQLQKQLQAAQQAAESNAHEAAAERIQCVTAAMEASVRQQLRPIRQQLEQLCGRTQALEEGTGIGDSYDRSCDARYAAPDSPAHRHTCRQSQAGFGSSIGAETVQQDDAIAAAARAGGESTECRDGGSAAGAAPDAPRVNVAAIVAAFEGSPPPPGARDCVANPEGGDAAASPAPADANPPSPAGAPAAALSVSVQSLSNAQSSQVGGTSPSGRQWRLLPVPSSVLAEATGAAAAAAASQGADSSVAARNDGGGSTSSTGTVDAASIGSSHGADSTAPADATAAAAQAIGKTAASPLAISVESCASGPAGAAPSRTALRSPQRVLAGGMMAAVSQGSGVCDAESDSAASPSVKSLSPALPQQGLTAARSFTTSSRPHPAVASATASATAAAGAVAGGTAGVEHALLPMHDAAGVAAGWLGALQAYSATAADAPGSATPPRSAGAQHSASCQQVSPLRALSGTETDCASELQQLLDLQQQVQQCLLDSGCVAVGRRAKPPKERHSRKGHKRSWLHTRATSSSPEAGDADEQGEAAAVTVGAAAAVGGDAQVAAVASPQQGPSRVEAAIAAAAAALAQKPQQQFTAGASYPQQQQQQQQQQYAAAFPLQQPPLSQQQQQEPDMACEPQQQQQQQQQQYAQAAMLPEPPLPKPSRSLEIRSLLTLQQQLRDCLKEHGCFLEQQRQQQQAAPSEPPSFMTAAGGSGIAGLQQQQQWQQQQQVQQVPQAQRYSVQEVELEQLLMLQAQIQQAVRHQGPAG